MVDSTTSTAPRAWSSSAATHRRRTRALSTSKFVTNIDARTTADVVAHVVARIDDADGARRHRNTTYRERAQLYG